jgi:hypothetical protein
MAKLARWDDDKAITHNYMRMRVTCLNQPFPNHPHHNLYPSTNLKTRELLDEN